jgi:hypothetical protein
MKNNISRQDKIASRFMTANEFATQLREVRKTKRGYIPPELRLCGKLIANRLYDHLTVRQIAPLLGVSTSTVVEWVNEG